MRHCKEGFTRRGNPHPPPNSTHNVIARLVLYSVIVRADRLVAISFTLHAERKRRISSPTTIIGENGAAVIKETIRDLRDIREFADIS